MNSWKKDICQLKASKDGYLTNETLVFIFSEATNNEALATLPLTDDEDEEEMLKRAIAMSLGEQQ